MCNMARGYNPGPISQSMPALLSNSDKLPRLEGSGQKIRKYPKSSFIFIIEIFFRNGK